MNKFIQLVESFLSEKIGFKEFRKEWFELHHVSCAYDNLLDTEKDFVDEIGDKEDLVTQDVKELEDLKKYHFISTEEFKAWLSEYLLENEKIVSKYLNLNQ